jgi:hypothetical protein
MGAMHDMLENGRINRTPASGMIDQTDAVE